MTDRTGNHFGQRTADAARQYHRQQDARDLKEAVANGHTLREFALLEVLFVLFDDHIRRRDQAEQQEDDYQCNANGWEQPGSQEDRQDEQEGDGERDYVFGNCSGHMDPWNTLEQATCLRVAGR